LQGHHFRASLGGHFSDPWAQSLFLRKGTGVESSQISILFLMKSKLKDKLGGGDALYIRRPLVS
jgi:hypothetical protein